MKTGYTGMTKSETRGFIRDFKDKEYIEEALEDYENEYYSKQPRKSAQFYDASPKQVKQANQK